MSGKKLLVARVKEILKSEVLGKEMSLKRALDEMHELRGLCYALWPGDRCTTIQHQENLGGLARRMRDRQGQRRIVAREQLAFDEDGHTYSTWIYDWAEDVLQDERLSAQDALRTLANAQQRVRTCKALAACYPDIFTGALQFLAQAMETVGRDDRGPDGGQAPQSA